MPDVICNTSPLQYLHQIGLLHLLPALVKRIIVPEAVVRELAVGKVYGIDVPVPDQLEWIAVRQPVSVAAVPLVTDLGPGETEVLALALEASDAIVILDDALARRMAETLGLRFTGTLGILIDAKKAGLVPAVAPLLDRLHALRFRLDPRARAAVLRLAGEDS